MQPLELDRLLAAAASFLRCHDRAELCARVTHTFCEILDFRVALLRLVDPRDGHLELWAAAGPGEEERARLYRQDLEASDLEELLATPHRRGRCYLMPDTGPDWSEEHRLHVPLMGSDSTLLGMIELDGPGDACVPRDEPLRLAERLADQAVLALENVSHVDELDRASRELSRLFRRIDELEKNKDEFLNSVSHELRTPLTSIQAYCETLLGQNGRMEIDMSREFLQVILNESGRLHERVEDLLAVARGEREPEPGGHEQVDLKELVRLAVERMSALLQERSIGCRTVLPVEPVHCIGEREAFTQLLLELLENALKFSPERGEIVVRLQQNRGHLDLEVEDSGEGVPEEAAGRIFERFYQVDGSSTRAYAGQGLGLAMCRQIVERHGGRIWVEKGERGGACFKVRMPRQRAVLRSALDGGLASELPSGAELRDFLDLSVALVAELTGCGIVSIMTPDEKDGFLRVQAAVGLSEEVVRRTKVESGKGISGKVFRDMRTMMLSDIRVDEDLVPRVNDEQYKGFGFLSVPLLNDGQVVGVLNVNNKLDESAFDDHDRLLLEALAQRVGRAWECHEQFRRGHEQLLHARETLRSAVELSRDRRTALREAVARCGLEAARADGALERELRGLAYALRIYDIGLLGVGAEILGKVGPLTAEDRRRVKLHASRGADLGSVLEQADEVEETLYHHHENWDGSGYPDGISGESIPRGARVARIVDAFSAMLHGRPGRSPLGLDEALALIREGLGRRFCPRIGPLFLEAAQAQRDSLFIVAGGRVVGSPPETTEELPVPVGVRGGGYEEEDA